MSATAADTHSSHRAEHFDDALQQHTASQLGMWVFLATEVLFFGVLFASYAIGRIHAPEGFALGSRHTDVLLGGIEAVILLLSSATMTWAVLLIERDVDARSVITWLLAVTALLGAAFLVLHGIEYLKEYHEHLIPGVDWAQSGPHAAAMEQFFFLYYAMTGYHSVHVLVGIGAITTIAIMVWRGRIQRGYTTPLVLTGLYWSLVDIVWVFLYPLIYLISR